MVSSKKGKVDNGDECLKKSGLMIFVFVKDKFYVFDL